VASTYTVVIVKPEQVKKIVALLPDPRHKMLVLVCASTAIRASEGCGLKWGDINWDENQSMIERRWTAACPDKPKTKASKAPVAMSPELAGFLHQWRKVTQYSGDEDWILPSYKINSDVRRDIRHRSLAPCPA
jgi:integrase